MTRNQRDEASDGQLEENEPWGPADFDDPGEDAEADSVEIDYVRLQDEMFEQFLVDHGRRVRVMDSALARLIDLMTVRRGLGGTDDEANGPVGWEGVLHHIRRLVELAVWDLADALTDLEGYFNLEWGPWCDDPPPPNLLAFDWLRSITCEMLNRARYVDTLESLPEGRGVYRQQPPGWPPPENLVARTVKCLEGQVVNRPSPHGDLSGLEILATEDELGALRSCLALLRMEAASEVSLRSVGRYPSKRVPSKLPSPAGQSTARSNDRSSTKACGYLGFRIDVDRREVFRNGHEQGVILTRLPFAIFNILVRVKGDRVSHEALEKAWEKVDRDKPGRSTLYVAVSELRGSLEPFGVRIENSPSLGYR
jgi:hypothetical protein